MACTSCPGENRNATNDPRWRRILWIALVLNAAMFLGEIGAGIAGDSKALQADALDFLGDSANYAISLGVAGMALAWRARAALVKGATIFLFGLAILGATLWSALNGSVPHAEMMGVVGFIALAVNLAVAVLLYRYRTGDANMRSVWICSRNDAIGNLAVMAAALGVFGTGTAWPDLVVATMMAGLGLWGGMQIIVQARDELRSETSAALFRSRVEQLHE